MSPKVVLSALASYLYPLDHPLAAASHCTTHPQEVDEKRAPVASFFLGNLSTPQN